MKLLSKAHAFQFFSYLFNLEEWAEQDQLRSDTGVDRQIVKSSVVWHSDHLQVGKRHVQMFSLKTTPEASRPCLFSGLFSLDCDSVLCSSWRMKSASAACSEIDAQEKFISFFKVGVLIQVEGELRSRKYDSKKTNSEQTVCEIRVNSILKLGRAAKATAEEQEEDDAPQEEAGA